VFSYYVYSITNILAHKEPAVNSNYYTNRNNVYAASPVPGIHFCGVASRLFHYFLFDPSMYDTINHIFFI